MPAMHNLALGYKGSKRVIIWSSSSTVPDQGMRAEPKRTSPREGPKIDPNEVSILHLEGAPGWSSVATIMSVVCTGRCHCI